MIITFALYLPTLYACPSSLFQMMRREPVSKSCDVYSYGIFAWEIITRKVPFSDVKSYEISLRVAKGEV